MLIRVLPYALMAVCALSSCDAGTTPQPYSPPSTADLSQLGWTEAFDALNRKMSQEYGFTRWKKVHWKKMRNRFRPRIEKAELMNDQEAYYMALREYLFSIPDGHVNLRWLGLPLDDEDGLVENGLGTYKKQVGGGFGFTAARLDNGTIIANWVKKNGPAASVGMCAGAQILKWGNGPAKTAFKKTSVIWSSIPSATKSGRDYEKMRFLVRAPIGTCKKISFKNRGHRKVVRCSLIAIDDGMETLKRINPFGKNWIKGVYPKRMVESRTLRGNIGYIKIYGEVDEENQPPTLTQFQEAIAAFKQAKISGLILDVRGNRGGEDSMGASMLGSFYKKKVFYEYQNWYNANSGKMEIILSTDDNSGAAWKRGAALYIDPAHIHCTGPVVALINSGCISTGEGIPLHVKKLSHGTIVGFRGTNGSFGMVLKPMALMPGQYLVGYPIGQSLNPHKEVQVDSKKGRGGVSPTNRVPMTRTNAVWAGAGRDVELAYALRLIHGMIHPMTARRPAPLGAGGIAAHSYFFSRRYREKDTLFTYEARCANKAHTRSRGGLVSSAYQRRVCRCLQQSCVVCSSKPLLESSRPSPPVLL